VLRAHLKDIYDFAFIQRVDLAVDSTPRPALANRLIAGGYAAKKAERYFRYGIGEFKASGEALLDDFDDTEPRKAPDTPDLFVCWDFDQARVEDFPWVVERAAPEAVEFEGQTHVWTPQLGVARDRVLPVIALATLLEALVDNGIVAGAPALWPDSQIPEVYY
jgi:hypothetical protein